jgi:hypothetical protein
VNEDRLPLDVLLIGIARASARAITEDPAFNDREKAFLLGNLSRQIPYGLARDSVWWTFRHWRDGHPPSLDELVP